MGDPTVGWIAAIIIGGIAGWLAEQFMKSDMGLLMNIVLGIVGAAVASAILSFFGIALGGWLGYLIAGFIGACLLIWVVRWIKDLAGQLKGGHRASPSPDKTAMSNMLAGSRTRTGKPKIERGHQPKSMALRSLSIVEAKSNLAGLPRRDQDEPSSPVNAGLN